jgi:uncharacterized protein (DUF427 family)
MAIDLREWNWRSHRELRLASTPKRNRAALHGETVLDTRDAFLVWEPRRIVPQYAVPPGELHLTLTEQQPAPLPEPLGPVLEPHHPEWHTAPGTTLHAGGLGEVAFRPDGPSLGGRIVVRFDRFDWREEDAPVISHPHDPYARIDVLRSDRHVRVEVAGTTVAESSRPTALFETGLPVRWYLLREDVRVDLLTPSDTHTTCAYKGVASYLSFGDAADVAWFYPEPLNDATQVKDMLSFWHAATVYVDGMQVPTGMPGDGADSAVVNRDDRRRIQRDGGDGSPGTD